MYARAFLFYSASQSKHPAEHIQHTLSPCNLHRSYFTRSERAKRLLLYILFVCICERAFASISFLLFLPFRFAEHSADIIFSGHSLFYYFYLLVCCSFSFGCVGTFKRDLIIALAAVRFCFTCCHPRRSDAA